MTWLRTIPPGATAMEVVGLVERTAEQRGWSAPTKMNAVNTIQGAVKRARYYGFAQMTFVHDTAWFDYKRAVGKEVSARFGFVQQAEPLQRRHLQRAVRAAMARKDWESAVVLILAWSTVGRIGDVLKLQRPEVTLEGQNLKCRFLEGKGVTLRKRPYTVHSTVKAMFVSVVSRWLQAEGGPRLFQDTHGLRKKLRNYLRDCNKKYEMRSVRRGAAIAMARNNVDIETIRHFTGHASVEMTERYLSWGWWDGKRAMEDRKAAAFLWC
jgi:integrase